MVSDFENLDVSPEEAKLLEQEFGTLLSFSNAETRGIAKLLDIDKERASEIIKDGKNLAIQSSSGFTKPDNYEEHKKEAKEELPNFEELGKIFPREIRQDINDFVSFMSEEGISNKTQKNYRNAVRRFYYFNLQKHGAKTKISLDDEKEVEKIKSRLQEFVVSNNNRLATKKYMEYYFDDKDKIDDLKDFIDSIEYERDSQLDIEIPWV